MTDPAHWLSYPDAPRIVHLPPGPRSKEMLARQSEWESEAVAYPRNFPIAIRAAQGATVEDVDGNRFIDWMSGISVLNLGHRHARLAKALEAQATRIWHALELPTEARLAFLEEIRASLPGGLRNRARILFTVTGGDSIETAVNLADYVQRRPGTVAFSGAYHGVHGGAANLTSGKKYHQTTSFHGGSIIRVPYPDPYRPILDSDGTTHGTLRYLEHLISDPYSGIDSFSSVLVEPILGEGGYVVPPPDFLPALREFCTRHDLLLILDEVQTGLGRTGKMWAAEHSGVTPDILCVAKTIGGGLPLSLVAYRDDLPLALPVGFHLGTFRANPLALAVGAEVLRTLRDEEWIARAARKGPQLLEKFRDIQRRHPSIGDVRGQGFMIGTEFVQDPRRRQPWGDRAKAMRHELLMRGVLMHTCGPFDQTLRFMAPLVIEDELLDRGLAAFEESIGSLDSGPAPGARARASPATIPGPEPFPSRLPAPVHPIPTTVPPGRTLP